MESCKQECKKICKKISGQKKILVGGTEETPIARICADLQRTGGLMD
jgi:hypothetical protein